VEAGRMNKHLDSVDNETSLCLQSAQFGCGKKEVPLPQTVLQVHRNSNPQFINSASTRGPQCLAEVQGGGGTYQRESH
jgi:hypothetical protein